MRTNTPKPARQAKGFLLLEVVLALGVFSLAAVGFTMALHKAADAADMTAREIQVTRILESALDEAISVPVLEEGEATVDIDERSMQVLTRYEKMEEMENQDGQLLQEMWRITVTASYVEGGNRLERSAITWRYGRLYQP